MSEESDTNARDVHTRQTGKVSDFSQRSSRSVRGRPRRKRNSTSNFVKVADFSSFDSALKKFMRVTSDICRLARRRRFFYPIPTRNARKRKGKILEVRRQQRESQEEKQE